MEFTWLGAAGFLVRTGKACFLIDPYLTRSPTARPEIRLTAADLGEADRIFITHGHFDHLWDVPDLVDGGARVWCSPQAAATLRGRGVLPDRIGVADRDGWTEDFGEYRATAFFSRHVRFDAPLVLRTLLRANVRIPGLLPLIRQWPPGRVLSWRFEFEDGALHHFGSAGSTAGELDRLKENRTRVLMIPLQGHTRICDIALGYALALRPEAVVVHHYDDFYPPISMLVDPAPFVAGVRREASGTRVIVPEPGVPFSL